MISGMIVPLLAATVQSGTPILLATLEEIVTEKSGVLNLGVEGMLLVGALAGFLVSQQSGSPWLGLAAAGIVTAVFSGLHALICVFFLGNQVVSGLAVPFLSEVPFLGRVLFNQDALVYLFYFLPAAVFVFLNRSKWGLRLRAVGENPEAARSAGISVSGYRWLGTMLGGFLVGLGGACLSLAYTHLWTSDLSGGRGWIAVALIIFAFWRPFRAIIGAYLFGGIMAFQLRLQTIGVDVPSSFLLMLPYVLTVVVLTFSYKKGRHYGAPVGLGVNPEPGE
ncbi:MAG: ABC transporter permease [Desulfonatronovibrionaceae bacterium]